MKRSAEAGTLRQLDLDWARYVHNDSGWWKDGPPWSKFYRYEAVKDSAVVFTTGIYQSEVQIQLLPLIQAVEGEKAAEAARDKTDPFSRVQADLQNRLRPFESLIEAALEANRPDQLHDALVGYRKVWLKLIDQEEKEGTHSLRPLYEKAIRGLQQRLLEVWPWERFAPLLVLYPTLAAGQTALYLHR